MSNPDGTPSDERVAAATDEARGLVREGLATELGGELAGLRSEVTALRSAISNLDAAIEELGGTWAQALNARVRDLRRERRRVVISAGAAGVLLAALVFAATLATRPGAIANELCPIDVRLDRLERLADDLIVDGKADPAHLTPEVCR